MKLKVRLQKEGRWLDLTAPFGELDPVCDMLFTDSGLNLFAHKKKKGKRKKKESENPLGSLRPFWFNFVADRYLAYKAQSTAQVISVRPPMH